MKIEKIDINLLNSSEYNPRKDLQPEDIEYQKIKRSIEEFGYVDPIIVNKDMTVIGGNQRIKVLKELDYKKVDCVLLDLNKTREKALNIALNKIEGEWDLPKLKDLLQELDTGEIDMDITGFDYTDLEELMTQFYVPDESEKDDEVPDIPEEPISKLGDLYKLGEHRLLCGDSTKIEDVKRLMDGKKTDMVFTDPPYNLGIKYYVYKDKRNDYWEWTKLWVRNLINFSKEKASFYIKQYQHNLFNQWEICKNEGIKYRNFIVWKNYSQQHPKNNYDTAFEIILFGSKNLNLLFHTWAEKRQQPENWWSGEGKPFKGKMDNLWLDIKPIAAGCLKMSDLEKIGHKKQHPTEMPIGLPARAIKFSSNENDIVLDLFGGSGSTLIACEKMKRICYMMEIDPHYVDVIIKRYENYTDNKAELIENLN